MYTHAHLINPPHRATVHIMRHQVTLGYLPHVDLVVLSYHFICRRQAIEYEQKSVTSKIYLDPNSDGCLKSCTVSAKLNAVGVSNTTNPRPI